MGKIKLNNDQELEIVADGIQELGDSLIITLLPDDKALSDFEALFSVEENVSTIWVVDYTGELFHAYKGFTKLIGLEKLYETVIEWIENETGEDTPVKGPAVKITLRKLNEEELAAQYIAANYTLLNAAITIARTDAQMYNDVQALAVQDIYEFWKADTLYPKDYKINFMVEDKKILFRCLTEHTSQEDWKPDVSPSLWAKVLIPDPEVIPDWEQPESTNPYMKGDKVKHKGKTWESLVDNNVWEPGVVGTEAQWKEVEEE